MVSYYVISSCHFSLAISKGEGHYSHNFSSMFSQPFFSLYIYIIFRCTYCQELAPTWEQLAKEWADHEKVLIGEIDCTVQKSFCKSMIGLPTLQYGDPFGQGSFLIDYNGEKDSDSLLQFVNDTLVSPICGPSNFDACEPVMSGRLKYFMSMGIGELEGAVRDHETQIESAQNKFDHEFKLLKVEYDAAASEHQRLTTRIQSTIKLIKSVQEYRQRGKFWKRKNGEL